MLGRKRLRLVTLLSLLLITLFFLEGTEAVGLHARSPRHRTSQMEALRSKMSSSPQKPAPAFSKEAMQALKARPSQQHDVNKPSLVPNVWTKLRSKSDDADSSADASAVASSKGASDGSAQDPHTDTGSGKGDDAQTGGSGLDGHSDGSSSAVGGTGSSGGDGSAADDSAADDSASGQDQTSNSSGDSDNSGNGGQGSGDGPNQGNSLHEGGLDQETGSAQDGFDSGVDDAVDTRDPSQSVSSSTDSGLASRVRKIEAQIDVLRESLHGVISTEAGDVSALSPGSAGFPTDDLRRRYPLIPEMIEPLNRPTNPENAAVYGGIPTDPGLATEEPVLQRAELVDSLAGLRNERTQEVIDKLCDGIKCPET